MAISPEQKKHGAVFTVSLALILGLCWLMHGMFELPTTTLASPLGDAQVEPSEPQYFDLKDGASFNGMGKIRIGEEEIEIQRIDGKTKQGFTAGAELLKNPNTFKVVSRGANGTPISAHEVGAEVSYSSGTTLFFPENNASFGDAVDELFYLILWITGIAFILTEAFFLFCVLCFWDGPGRQSEYVHGNHRFEMGATLVVVSILVLLALLQNQMWTQMKQIMPVSTAGRGTFAAMEAKAEAADSPSKKPAIEVQIVAKRFAWYFRYPGLDGKFATADDVTTRDDLRVPPERDVLFHLRSMDVLHSLFLPNYRVKQDAVPGMAIPGWFRPLRPGSFQIMCAELCGEGHSNMGAKMQVLSAEDFRTWMTDKSTEALEFNEEEDRAAWFGGGDDNSATWWWWDTNPVRVGYAQEYQK